jgi:hypothetical protein
MTAELGFNSCSEQRFFIFTTLFQLVPSVTHPTVQLVTGVVSLGLKLIGLEHRQLFPSSADGNMLIYTLYSILYTSTL